MCEECRRERVPVFTWEDCPFCLGSARVGDAPCWHCKGTGYRAALQTDPTNPNRGGTSRD